VNPEISKKELLEMVDAYETDEEVRRVFRLASDFSSRESTECTVI
jgi:hypothetical protein